MRISAWEREREVLRTLVQENLFPTIVNGLLRVLVLFALEDGCKRGDVLHTSPKPVRNRLTELKTRLTSASRKRISDLRLPFLIEPGHELSADPKPKIKGRVVDNLTHRARYRSRGETATSSETPLAGMNAP